MSHVPPLVVAVVPVFNRLATTKRFVEAFRSQHYERKKLVICDDGSTDGTGEYLLKQPDVITVRGDGSLWWSGGTNAAVREALKLGADYVLTINDDSEIEPDYLDALLRDARQFPESIMASSLIQLQKPDRHWSLGASYLNYRHVLYVNDCCGASSAHIRRLMQPTVHLDTMPGNGVLYPARVFVDAGYFDETWTPQYHGDTLFAHRAAKAGYELRLSLGAVVKNDMGHHQDAKNYDPLLSMRSPNYSPAVYKSVEEREGKEAALDFLGCLSAVLPSEFFPAENTNWKKLQSALPPAPFVFDPHFAHTLSGGAFAFLGYSTSRGLSVTPPDEGNGSTYQLNGSGLLKLTLRIRRRCIVYGFVVTGCRPEHLDVFMPHRSLGPFLQGDECIIGFRAEMEPADFASIHLSVINGPATWRGLYLALEENVAEEFRAAV